MSKIKKYIIEYQQLMEEYDWDKNNALGFDPTKLSYGSSTKVWWKCKNGHEFEQSLNHRTRGRGCPICAQNQRGISHSRKWIEKNGSLASNNPDLSKQWHLIKNGVLTPHDVSQNSLVKVWWLCDKGHEWLGEIRSRNNGVDCPICSGHKILVGYNDLATVNPKLASQWHPTKNNDLKPTDVTASNGKKVWWLCEKGHEWEAKVANRTVGDNCPICSGHKVLVGYNDLVTVNPNIAKEWHPTKNGDLKPTNYTSGSNKIVWWQCEKGHEWKTSISHRTSGRRCPVCYGETKTSFPEQAIFYYFKKLTLTYNRYKIDKNTEIDVYLPDYNIGIEYDGLFFHSGKIAEEREKRKEEKLKLKGITLIRVKETKNTNNINANNIFYVSSGPNDNELSDLINKLISYINNIKQIKLSIDINISRDKNLIYEQYIETEKNNSLLLLNPDLSNEWHPTKNGKLLPEHVTASSNKKVWWLCSKGHEWQSVINSRNKGVGCPYCTGKKAIPGYNDLKTINPIIASQWHMTKNGELKPEDFTISSNKKVWWQCEKGHEWEAMIYDRTNGTNCPICSGHKVLIGYNDLGTLNPKLAKEWHPIKNGNLKPQDVTTGSSKKVWWQCEKGHEWEALIYTRSSGCGCPYCAGQRLISGENDLATINPKLAKEWHPTKNNGLTPEQVMPGSNKKVWWKCKNDHEWQATISSRNSGRGCLKCYKENK